MFNIFDESKVFTRDLSIWDNLLSETGDESFIAQPLDFFTAASLGETSIIKSYLERKLVEVDAKNCSGWSAMMYGAYMGHDDCIDILIKYGADYNIKSPKKCTPLILAAMCGNDSVIKTLAQHKADLEATDSAGWTALFHAASAGHQQATELLLDYGANVEAKEPSQGLTPLMEAAASGHELVVQHLLKKGACATTKDRNGDDAMSLAFEYGHVKIASIIEQSKQVLIASHKSENKSHKPLPSVNKCNLSGGPSIHAGPKAFAQMTGLGADGKPHPHNAVPIFLQDNQQPQVNCTQLTNEWSGPKSLEALLKNIDCSKYLHVFESQGVDLQIFLTLSEADLKEIGISLFGPRRKMVSVISRLLSEVESVVTSNRNESSYADAINIKLIRLQDRFKEMEAENLDLRSLFAQERQLRKITESVLMESKDMISKLRREFEKVEGRQAHINRIVDGLRSQSFNKHFENMHLTNSGILSSKPDKSVIISPTALHDLDLICRDASECLHSMRGVLEKASNVAGNVVKPTEMTSSLKR